MFLRIDVGGALPSCATGSQPGESLTIPSSFFLTRSPALRGTLIAKLMRRHLRMSAVLSGALDGPAIAMTFPTDFSPNRGAAWRQLKTCVWIQN